MIIELEKGSWAFSALEHRDLFVVLCVSKLHEYVGVPLRAKRIELVLTKSKPSTPHHFKLTNDFWNPVKGVDEFFVGATSRAVLNMYNKGYRYVYVRYDA